MKLFSSLFISLFLLLSLQSYAQVPDNNVKDIFTINTPAVEYSTLDTTGMLWEDDIVDPSRFDTLEYVFIPELGGEEESVLWFDEEDEEGEMFPVLTQEQLSVGQDSTWVTYAEY